MNELPLSLYIAMCTGTVILILFSLMNRENMIRIITSFLSMVMAYLCSFTILSGNVVLIQSDGSTYSYIPVINTSLNYFWLFIAVLMGIFMVLFIIDEINIVLTGELETTEVSDDY